MPEGYKLGHPVICSSLVAVMDLGRDNLSLVENVKDQFNVKSYVVSMFPGVAIANHVQENEKDRFTRKRR